MRQRLLLSISALCLGCQTFVGDYELNQPLETAPLCAIESTVFAVELDLESDEQLPSLDAYYIEANPALVQHLSLVARDHIEGAVRRGVTYVLGDAGIGKSYVMRNAFDDFGDTKCEIVLRELAASSQADLTTTEGVTFNELPIFHESTEFNLAEVLTEKGCIRDGVPKPLIFLDGIDEIHDISADVLLRAVDELVLQETEPFMQVVIAGRPEGFRPWLTNPARTERNKEIVSQFHLRAPEYRTRGDLEFRLRGYLDYAGELAEIEAKGEFDEYLDSFVHVLSEHPFLTYSIGNLGLGNFAIQHTVPGLDESELQMKSGILDDLLARNSETHHRPGAGSALDGQYRRILEQIAVTYASVTDKAEFSVAAQDTVVVTDESGVSAGFVRVRDVLLHSGLAYLTSASSTTTRFRFSPFWVQGFLIESFNQRQGEPYVGCDVIKGP